MFLIGCFLYLYYCKLSKRQLQRGERRAVWRKRVFVGTCWNAAAAFLVHHQPLKGDHHHYHHCLHHQHYYHHCHHHCRLDWRATLLHRFWSISNTPPTEFQPLEVGIIVTTFFFISLLPLFAPAITAVRAQFVSISAAPCCTQMPGHSSTALNTTVQLSTLSTLRLVCFLWLCWCWRQVGRCSSCSSSPTCPTSPCQLRWPPTRLQSMWRRGF